MKIKASIVSVLVMSLCMPVTPLRADPVVHKFQLWGVENTTDKMNLYRGWTNGFFQARGEKSTALLNCLQKLSTDQAIAMIDKHYKDHPEKWSHALGIEIIEALTIAGGPCEGLDPFPLVK